MADADAIAAGRDLFDNPPDSAATATFLASPGHHLLFAYAGADTSRPVGFISGAELTHPDKGTEMYLNELGVANDARGRGIATQLVEALAALARQRGCYGMWVVADPDNAAALATYHRARARDESPTVVFAWEF